MPGPRERMEARITSWFKHLQESEKTERREKNRPFVTISRESGAYGMTIADLLAEHLHQHERCREASWAVFDKELIQMLIEKHKFPVIFEKYFLESSTPLIEDIFAELFGLHPPQETFVRSISETILHLATLGYVILGGRGANIITRKLPNGTHVRLIDSFKKRVAHMKEYLNLPEKQACEYVIKEDHIRKAYIKRYFRKDISDVSLYDLIINTDTVPLQEAVTIIRGLVLRTQCDPIFLSF
jgi:cytidylate kinase